MTDNERINWIKEYADLAATSMRYREDTTFLREQLEQRDKTIAELLEKSRETNQYYKTRATRAEQQNALMLSELEDIARVHCDYGCSDDARTVITQVKAITASNDDKGESV